MLRKPEQATAIPGLRMPFLAKRFATLCPMEFLKVSGSADNTLVIWERDDVVSIRWSTRQTVSVVLFQGVRVAAGRLLYPWP